METTFRILTALLFVSFMANRAYYTKKHEDTTENNTKNQKPEDGLSRITGVLALVGLLGVAAYVINPNWVAWAQLPMTTGLRWVGVGLAVLGFGLLQTAMVTLGRNWSDTPQLVQDQVVVRSGVYSRVRHPIYTAFVLILSAPLFLTANWLIGGAWILSTVVDTASRIQYEENLLVEEFGDGYREYMKDTWRMLPGIW